MEPLSHEQLLEILSTIDPSENGQRIISVTSDNGLLKIHEGLHELSKTDTQDTDYRVHARLIEAELHRRNIPFESLNW